MDISPMVPKDRKLIEGYGAEGFRIAGTLYAGSVLLMRDRVLEWDVTAMDELTIDRLEPLFGDASDLEILLLGCGLQGVLPPKELRLAVRERGPVLDSMDSGAACRTYNVLLAEERRVAAALILPRPETR
ncbi:Mth938-like domain-containing protein [Limibacillus halophilus]|uniref:Uncharacterized protein n=1 Tax=Limibacillus halophilus TaxID=1579333 RepID=A0A839SSV6_9PROT|nr:Mth938-like domain-containing protein [Limibacillus halophilus]MBB3065562.1 uncharacterized protein [Limibacillus halophilus]